MVKFIIKAAPDRDLYMEWSTVVEAPTFVGTRVEVVAELQRRHDYRSNDPTEVRLRRADETGTSAIPDSYFDPLPGAWDHPGLIVEQRGWLRGLGSPSSWWRTPPTLRKGICCSIR